MFINKKNIKQCTKLTAILAAEASSYCHQYLSVLQTRSQTNKFDLSLLLVNFSVLEEYGGISSSHGDIPVVFTKQ